MPELPEVQTTAKILNRRIVGHKISHVWTNYGSAFHYGKNNIKDPRYFKKFASEVEGEKIVKVSRVGKNVLIHLTGNKTILVHMKMTGHLLYGKYKHDTNPRMKTNDANKKNKTGEEWVAVGAGPLRDDPFNRFVRLVFTLDNSKRLVLSDLRRFAKVTLIPTDRLRQSSDLAHIGPDPLDKTFSLKIFQERLLKRPRSKIKQALMDQALIAGVGNIYSDEALWRAKIHPASLVGKIPDKKYISLYKEVLAVLKEGIDFGGDSMSDYRTPDGTPGKFQLRHHAYRKTGKLCSLKSCVGIIERTKIGGRSAHFCTKHQSYFS